EQRLEAELSAQLGSEQYAAKGRGSGNRRNGHYKRKLRTSQGEAELAVPRDVNGDYSPKLLHKDATSSNELEDKRVALYARGLSVRDIQDNLKELYGVEISAQTISAVTDKVGELVEAWPHRPLATVDALVYLAALYMKLRREGRLENVAVDVVLG